MDLTDWYINIFGVFLIIKHKYSLDFECLKILKEKKKSGLIITAAASWVASNGDPVRYPIRESRKCCLYDSCIKKSIM